MKKNNKISGYEKLPRQRCTVKVCMCVCVCVCALQKTSERKKDPINLFSLSCSENLDCVSGCEAQGAVQHVSVCLFQPGSGTLLMAFLSALLCFVTLFIWCLLPASATLHNQDLYKTYQKRAHKTWCIIRGFITFYWESCRLWLVIKDPIVHFPVKAPC